MPKRVDEPPHDQPQMRWPADFAPKGGPMPELGPEDQEEQGTESQEEQGTESQERAKYPGIWKGQRFKYDGW